MCGAVPLLHLYVSLAFIWTATVHENSSTHERREKCMQGFSRKTRRTVKGDLNGKCVDVMKQGWPQRSSLTSPVRLAQVPGKDIILR